MTDNQVREIVKITLDELIARNMLKDSYKDIARQIESRLVKLLLDNEVDPELSKALRSLSDDPYIDIIYAQYRDSKTLEWTAEYFERDVSTIKRNKKRLLKTIYLLCEDK